MLRPEQFADAPLRLTCNCCERKVVVVMSMLENVDGTPFDERAWRIEKELKRRAQEGNELWEAKG